MDVMKYINYLKYLIKHKYYVLKGCFLFEVPILIGIFHDWSKLMPDELIGYANTFCSENKNNRYKETEEFLLAWNLHQKRHKHHWQHWVIIKDNDEIIPLEMSDIYIREMLADWYGASLAQFGKLKIKEWYENNKNIIKLHPNTRKKLENYIKFYLS